MRVLSIVLTITRQFHNSQTSNIHWDGHFILWHRYFVTTYEKALRDECGYTGGQPSTNLTGTAIYQTTIFDPNTSFSGNGPYVEATTEQNPLNITGHTDDGCVFKWPLRALEIQSTSLLRIACVHLQLPSPPLYQDSSIFISTDTSFYQVIEYISIGTIL